MQFKISKISELKGNTISAFLFDHPDQLPPDLLSKEESDYLSLKIEKENECLIYRYPSALFFCRVKPQKNNGLTQESARKSGAVLVEKACDENIKAIQIEDLTENGHLYSFLEGMLLSGYSFSKYKKEKDKSNELEIHLPDRYLHAVPELENLVKAVHWARDLVNEPLSYLTAMKFAEEMTKMATTAGFAIEVFNKQKIQSLKMGGLLAVNRGSPDPPTFSILEWKPEKAINNKPVIFVGKGIVFDTGGLSLKPTPKSMDYMKCDMAGAAAVAAAVYAAAANKLPVHVLALIPATDNRPDGNAYVPGDIITMYDGTTVEIRNTDAEGRLILADALGYAKKYDPELVIDMATLTGSADMIAWKHAMVGMGNSAAHLSILKETGEEVHERIIEVPLWEDYAEPLKSTIADLNNLGIREAQATIAGKFLEHFTGYNWIHLDMAGTAFFSEKGNYCPEGGTGAGVRLLYHFLKKMITSRAD